MCQCPLLNSSLPIGFKYILDQGFLDWEDLRELRLQL